MILTLPVILFYGSRAIGVENVPATGPVILAPNHFSQMDHFFAAVYLPRKAQFMAKSQLFKNPAIKYIFKHGGVFPVRRGHHDEEAFITANIVLDSGGTMLMYAEGGRSRSGDLGEPKRGIGKIALESGVPVVPVAIHGSAHVRGWKRLQFPKVTIQYGEPVTFPVNADPSRERAAAGGQPDLRPRPGDVRRPRAKRTARRAQAPARGPAGRRARLRAEDGPPLLLVTGLELLPELRVVPWHDQRVRIGPAVRLQLP